MRTRYAGDHAGCLSSSPLVARHYKGARVLHLALQPALCDESKHRLRGQLSKVATAIPVITRYFGHDGKRGMLRHDAFVSKVDLGSEEPLERSAELVDDPEVAANPPRSPELEKLDCR